jgi:hypothetical protein
MSRQGLNQEKSLSHSSSTPAKTGWFQSRPFAEPADSEAISTQQQETPDLQTQRDKAARFGHDFGQVRVGNTSSVIQPKLTVGAPGDKYEQEADKVAAQVMGMAEPTNQQPVQREMALEEEQELQMKPLASMITPLVQRQEVPEEEELQMKPLVQRQEVPKEELQMKPSSQESAASSNRASDNLENQLSSSKDGGSPLPYDVRSFMEPRFGVDFSQVRVHTDSQAVQMNQAVGAQAFTQGSDIYYGQGESPGISNLTAHELTHVVQQTDGLQRQIQRRATVVPAPFLGGSPFNDSSVTFTPRGAVWISGTETSTSNFPSQAEGTVQIRAGTKGNVQLHMNVNVLEDNLLINQSWSQSFYGSWKVSAASDGTLTIDSSPMVTINPRDGSISQSALQAVNPSQGSDFVMFTPIVQGASGTGGISVGVGMETNYPGSVIQRPFKLNIEVTDIQEPQGTVTFGPISILRDHAVLFERSGQSRVSGTQEGALISWYNGLSDAARARIESGAEPISLEGYASTTGDPARNRELSNKRMEEVRRILEQFVGNRAVFHTRSVGEYQAGTDDNVESAEERRVAVSVWEQMSEEESSTDTP